MTHHELAEIYRLIQEETSLLTVTAVRRAAASRERKLVKHYESQTSTPEALDGLLFDLTTGEPK